MPYLNDIVVDFMRKIAQFILRDVMEFAQVRLKVFYGIQVGAVILQRHLIVFVDVFKFQTAHEPFGTRVLKYHSVRNASAQVLVK